MHAVVVMMCGWLAATTLDAGNWFNRNLAIITNVERLLLTSADLTLVHPFFDKNRPAGRHAEHFNIQLWLSGAVWALVLVHHFFERVWPGFKLPWSDCRPSRALPYIAAPLVLGLLIWLGGGYKRKDEQFKNGAPGVTL